VKAYLTKSRRGSSIPERSATNDIAVDSPPGIMRASHKSSWETVLTSRNLNAVEGREAEAVRRSCVCSLKAPWRARTPTVIGGEGARDVIFQFGEQNNLNCLLWISTMSQVQMLFIMAG